MHAEFLAHDPRLPEDAREQAEKSMQAAIKAAHLVSELRQSLDCGGSPERLTAVVSGEDWLPG